MKYEALTCQESPLENTRKLLADAYDQKDQRRLAALSRLIDEWQCSLWRKTLKSQ